MRGKADIVFSCPACGVENPIDEKACTECGAAIHQKIHETSSCRCLKCGWTCSVSSGMSECPECRSELEKTPIDRLTLTGF